MDWGGLIGLGVSLGAGAATKWLGKKRGGTAYRILTPVAAIAGGIGTQVARDHGLDVDGTETLVEGAMTGIMAVGIYATTKSARRVRR